MRRRHIACIIPAIGVRPPFLILAAVLAIAPVAGIPPKTAEPILPTPCAISSILELCLSPTIPSATTHDNRDSIAASIAIVKASGTTSLNILSDILGNAGVGILDDISYRSPIVLTFKSRHLTSAAVTTTAISEPGILLSPLILGHTI